MKESLALRPGAIASQTMRDGGGVLSRRPGRLILYLLAFLIATAVLLPILYLVVRAAEAGPAVWGRIFSAATLQIILRTGGLALSVSAMTAAIAVPFAYLTTRTDLPLRRLWTILAPLPLVIPSYIGAYLFISTMGPRGLLQGVLESTLGIQRLPDLYGFTGAFFVLSLLNYPLVYLTVRAAFLRLDPATEEAARSLGRTPWQTFWQVTFPQLRPALAAGGLLVALYVLRDFGAVSILRYDTFTRVIYIQYQSTFDRAAAAALALVLVALTLLLLYGEVKSRGRAHDRQASLQAARPPRITSLGLWKWPAMLFCSLVILFALVMPSSTLLYWLVRGVLAGEQISGLWVAVQNTVLAAGLAALAATLAALPITILDVRRPSQVTHLLERATYIAYALPGIVIALALVFFGIRYIPGLYQSLAMLVFGYVILFLPQAAGALRASLLQVHPGIEEAGRSLGKSPLQVFRRITLPLISPGMAAGAALVFLTAVKELPTTLLLSPTGFPTLATGVWSAVSEAFFARAAAPALLLILLSAVPMALLNLHASKGKR
jgi:iron(III) transport system permease protein